jgi:hypothetical protein
MVDPRQASDAAGETVEEIAASLWRRAGELWGPERASQLGHVIDDTARDLWTVSQMQLSEADKPAFHPR